MSNKIVAAILSGGSGTRLWPQSRTQEPKQLQTLFGGQSLLAHTVERMVGHDACEAPLIVCGQSFSEEIADQLQSLDLAASGILEEPMGRDTAAAGWIAARWVSERYGPDAILMPAASGPIILRTLMRSTNPSRRPLV